jgi:prepilin-type processing-associated H-X9-DG protein
LSPYIASPYQYPEAVREEKRRHAARLVVSFCDGHTEPVKWFSFHEATEKGRRRWNFDNEPHRESWRGADDNPLMTYLAEVGP